MAQGLALPRRFRANADLRQTLEINFRYFGNHVNEVFGQPQYTPPFVPYATRTFRGVGELLPILNRHWRYTVTYINDFVQSEPTLAGIRGFASYPNFRGDMTDKELSSAISRNMTKLVTYLNKDVFPLL